jgi:transposase-like protein
MANITKANASQKGQEVPNFTEDQARAYFEKQRWGDMPCCVHCGCVNVTRLNGKAARPGTIQCNECREQFTVTVGTIMEDSHLALATWAKAFHLMASSKKGFSALQLQRNCGIGSYRTAWFLAHRIREAMRYEPVAGMLKGQVQVDETYVGGKPRRGTGDHKRGRGTSKAPVVALVETDGKVHSRHVERISSKNLRAAIVETCDPKTKLVTDEFPAYRRATVGFGGHSKVNHSRGQYVNRKGLHTNTAESFFALLKRGVHGTFHHVSKKHLPRYCAEFDFRWNGREVTDSERRDTAVKGSDGKRLMYHQPINAAGGS